MRVVIFGSTGMVGEGVLHECLKHSSVESILVINRRECGYKHEKLKEIILKDFSDFSPVADELSGYDACYFCMGISSAGKKENEYRKITYDITMNAAEVLIMQNKQMIFCYVSGAGTDSTEKGRFMWARVKGKTENDLLKLPFKAAYMFRPGYIQPIKGMKNTYKMYKILYPFYPVFNLLFSKYVCTLEQLGKSMINVTLNNPDIKILECEDIVRFSEV
ncbi:MAG: NAD-dependent epimerase/dehydratase family protein [Ignavibacteria bacterium]|jgi:hypothetical protein